VLQVWSAQHGPRVAAFSVSKWCRLICPDYGLMGLNNVTCRDFHALTHSVYLIDTDGSVKAIDIPFHLALRYAHVSCFTWLSGLRQCLHYTWLSGLRHCFIFHQALRYDALFHISLGSKV